MKKKIIVIVSVLLGFLAGIIFSGIVVSISSGEMMVKEFKSPYDFEKTVSVMADQINNSPNWHVTNIIDQNAEIIKCGGTPIGNYKIIKYCSGMYASRMLTADDEKKLGNMMPKTFAIYEKSNGQVFVSTMNGAVMGKFFGGEAEKVIEEVSLEIEEMMGFINLKYSLF